MLGLGLGPGLAFFSAFLIAESDRNCCSFPEQIGIVVLYQAAPGIPELNVSFGDSFGLSRPRRSNIFASAHSKKEGGEN